MNKKIAFIFSGQGSQYIGMGQELANLSKSAKKVFELGSDIVGFDILKKNEQSTEEEISDTQISQPSIMAVSLAALEIIKENGINCTAVAGHSLGEYAALVEASIITIEEGFKLIKERAKAMADCAKGTDGLMCAILGCNNDKIDEICQQIGGYVEAVNYNCPGQTVIAGEKDAVLEAVSKIEEFARKCTYLKVSTAFHSKLMGKASEVFGEKIKDWDFKDPKIDFYSNVTGGKVLSGSEIKKLMVSHLISPVLFQGELEVMEKDGIDTFIELGPKKTLSNLVKRTLKSVEKYNVEDEKSLITTLEGLRGIN